MKKTATNAGCGFQFYTVAILSILTHAELYEPPSILIEQVCVSRPQPPITRALHAESSAPRLSYKNLGNPIMAPDELVIMSGSRYILQLQGTHLFHSRKYDITKHTMYLLPTDADEGIRFEAENFLKDGFVSDKDMLEVS